jgi:putative RNA 2'-phosphotransferase
VSKELAKVLRHRPERLGLSLDPHGWVAVDELLDRSASAGLPITRDELDAAVHAPGKRRYAFDETGTRIRALQGHSVAVDLGLEPTDPPPALFHGTHPGALEASAATGSGPCAATTCTSRPTSRRPARSAGGAGGRSC